MVAIKKSKLSDGYLIKRFINEVDIVSQVKHRNVVKLMGCCLETKFPLLVYEFIPNYTLLWHIHNRSLDYRFSWEMRIKIAAEIAWAVAYLHSATLTPIVHRDIKSSKILLDHTYTAKLIGFGVSRLFALGQSELTTLLDGTIGYLDPEYFQTTHLSDKSDVYGFGVVLAELITGRRPFSYDEPYESRNLATCFVSAIQEDRLLQILDENLVEGDLIQLKRVAELTERCLRVKSKERPSMKEVAIELEALRSVENHQLRDEDFNHREIMEKLFHPATPSNINGGYLLQHKKLGDYSANEKIRIFTVEDLQRATNNYDEGNIIDRGRYGTIYKGILPDYGVVAIKKSIKIYQQQIEKYINELEIASQINHQNVVKTLGCCLGTEIPLLVYEFITNGTLFSHIHDPVLASNFSWEMRIKVAAEAAAALAYLHMVPVIHGDIKSANILLDQVYTAKVTDFGAYRLDNSESTTFVQGTIGYLDPEYLQFGQMTEKSDVYSFGVVLAELLTGRQEVSFDRPEEERSLATFFLSAIEEDLVLQILDQNLLGQDKIEQLKRVAKLSVWCLSEKREERPSMKEVAMELEALRSVENHPWTDEDLNHEKIMEHLFNRATSSNFNGGFLLHHKLSRDYLDIETVRIFTAEDLQRATNNYEEGNIIGRGGYGTVYKGNLPDYGVVAIKKSRIIYQGKIEKYINEVQIVSQINHQNVVKILGCCLETEAPLQVYEFITNGTLFSHIHDPILASNFSWEMRIKVAAETASALAYLHMVPIVHGDIKSANILLDQTYTAKVSDFGASRFDYRYLNCFMFAKYFFRFKLSQVYGS
ncbi:wall-associated receptor kinase 2-like [Olea europaea subsp. europaea]|uniref:Wall-associated receptor kinase 2-like n=1 Tax=Olea europaea subsp. europaea TaxID=158383 RepID=A0A8S0UQP8_OLEEU|nr:wall-associated receptor kinase 2-like [Olea europaea subsp. europaea]